MYGQVSLDVLPQQWPLLNPQHSLDDSARLLDPSSTFLNPLAPGGQFICD